MICSNADSALGLRSSVVIHDLLEDIHTSLTKLEGTHCQERHANKDPHGHPVKNDGRGVLLVSDHGGNDRVQGVQ
jgi:hypothetical protein